MRAPVAVVDPILGGSEKDQYGGVRCTPLFFALRAICAPRGEYLDKEEG
jgi:hypothetical protein